jgi:hypothetical protein
VRQTLIGIRGQRLVETLYSYLRWARPNLAVHLRGTRVFLETLTPVGERHTERRR